MTELVSIIIPCFNSEQWIEKAIDSCLNQTYQHLEIIVVDDGSTDNSLDIIKTFGARIKWETGINRGSNYARNRGFELSSGTYIQYLDADDYLLPEKIEQQVGYLLESDADLVYSDQLLEQYSSDEILCNKEVKVCGPHEDILEFLLSFEYFIQTANPLIKREAIARSDGWDESLKAAQDIDFFLELAMNGNKFLYHPGYHTVYRYYDSEDKISSNRYNLSKYRLLVIQKAEKKLILLDKLSSKNRKALAYACFRVALFGCYYLSYSDYRLLLRKTISLCPSFVPDSSMLQNGGKMYNILNNYLGFTLAGVIYRFLKNLSLYRFEKS